MHTMADTNNMVLIDADELAELRRGYDIYVRMSIPWEAMWNDAYYTHMHPTIPMQLLHPDAKLPQRQHPCDAGADICSIDDYDLQPGERHAIGTGLAMELPDEYVAYICPRSGLAIKHGITIINAPATIDANFRGELKVILQNTGTEPFHISKGDRIAQLEIVPIAYASFAKTGHIQDHPDSRDNGKFGSTGIK